VAQLPAHPQYLGVGTLYSVALEEPLDFGSEPLTAEMVSSIGTTPPEGALLAGVDTERSDHVELDAEGGAAATSPPTRYLSTALTIALAAASAGTDGDAHDVGAGSAAGNTSNRVAGGAAGFKLVGLALGIFVHSQPLGMAMGAAGASRSIYTNFIGPGRNVVFPKDTEMEISLSVRPGSPAPMPKQTANNR